MSGPKIGYARVSTAGQDLTAQRGGLPPRRHARGDRAGPARAVTADAQDIVEELTGRGVRLQLERSVHDPTDPVGRLLFNVLAMVAEFEVVRTGQGPHP